MSCETTAASHQLVDHLFRNRAGQMVAWLTRIFGAAHLDLAEEVVQDALVKALQQWPYTGVPDNPGGWLFRVARNRITDLFRRKGPKSFSDATVADQDEDLPLLEDLLPSPDAGPEALYTRGVLLEALELAVSQLPVEQREVFIAHELEGRSFKELAAESGVSVNTLLSRKRYAVLQLRKRLQGIYEEFKKA